MGLVVATVYLKETDRELATNDDERDSESRTSSSPRRTDDAAKLLREESEKSHRPLIYLMWISSFLNMIAFSAYIAMYGLYILEEFGYASLELGFISMGAGLIAIITQMTLYNPLRLKIGKHATLIMGVLIKGAGLAMIPAIKEPASAIAFVSLVSIGYGLSNPSVVSILSRYANETNQGSVLGIGMSMSAFARVVGPITMGAIYQYARGMPFYAGALVAVLNASLVFLVLCLNRRLPEHTTVSSPKNRPSVWVPRVRVGTDVDSMDDNDDGVTLFDFVVGLLTRRGYLHRKLNHERVEDIGEMATLLRSAVRPVNASSDGDFDDVAEVFDGYAKAPPHV